MFFNKVQIIESLGNGTYAGGLNINNDNEFFGQVYAGSMPEPSAIGLLALSMMGLFLR